METTMKKNKILSVEEITNLFAISNRRYVSFKVPYEDINDKLIPLCNGNMNAIILYLKMRLRIIREGWKDTKDFPLKELYYDNNKLVMSMSTRLMAKEFKVNRDRLIEMIQKLVEFKYIKVEKIKVKGNYLGQSVYVFGTWQKLENGDIIENYYNTSW